MGATLTPKNPPPARPCGPARRATSRRGRRGPRRLGALGRALLRYRVETLRRFANVVRGKLEPSPT